MLCQGLILELAQEFLTISGAASSACFFARLAAFFSFGVSNDCFFISLLVRWDLGMVLMLLVMLKKYPKRKGMQNRRHLLERPNQFWTAGCCTSYIECRRMLVQKIAI